MIRILVRAGLIAGVTALALAQLRNEQQLLVWELVLLGVLVWEMRRIPSNENVDDRPLFELSPRDTARLPRAVFSTELTVVDAVSGYLGPERRLQPGLRRIAAHRLAMKGIDFESTEALEALGEAEWVWLSNPTETAPDVAMLETVVSKVEAL